MPEPGMLFLPSHILLIRFILSKSSLAGHQLLSFSK
jgi:hypothetical protein